MKWEEEEEEGKEPWREMVKVRGRRGEGQRQEGA